MPDPTLSPEAAGQLSKEGWLIALIKTGYQKGPEMTTSTGSTVTVYQNPTEGKMCILVSLATKNEWISLYPQGGFWKGMHHYFDIHKDSKWIEKTPEQMREIFEAGVPEKDGERP